MPKPTTGIVWTDATWNPMTGCTRVSAGCDHCYAAEVAHSARLAPIYLAHEPVRPSAATRADPFAPRFWPARLDQPRRWQRPRRIFVNSMSDVFHAAFSRDHIAQVFAAMVAAPQHQFQLLTKRPERALRMVDMLPWPTNLWFGVSVESMAVAARVHRLRAIPAAVRWISAEPLLGPLESLDLTGVHWVVGGGESGPAARACDPAWARGLRDHCAAQTVPFLWKQWGGRTSASGGRLLDEVLHDAYPVAR